MGNSNSKINFNEEFKNNNEGNKELIFTFLFMTHGSIRNLTLTTEHQNTFDNCRLFSKAGDFICIDSIPNYSVLNTNLHINSTEPTFDRINKSLKTTPLPTITYDKTLSIKSWTELYFPDNYGIFLMSVNKKENGLYKYINLFPKELNLLYISELKKLADVFGTNVPELDNENFNINGNANDLNFTEWSGIQLSDNKEIIMKIKMSKFVEIIKNIVGTNNFFNLIDYSCSINRTRNLLDKPKYYVTEPINEENAAGEKIWGGKNKNKKRKNTNLKQKKNNKNKTKKKC
jgi:hypothetical protein